MAVNKPVGDNARKRAVKKRSQLKTKLGGATAWTKHNKKGGEFMAVKNPAQKKKSAKGRAGIGQRKGAGDEVADRSTKREQLATAVVKAAPPSSPLPPAAEATPALRRGLGSFLVGAIREATN